MKKLFIFYSFILVVAFSSCEKMVTDVDIPKVSPELVAFGFISPENDVIKIQVAMSKPVYGKQSFTGSESVTNAIVSITNDAGQSIILPYVDTSSAYVVTRLQYPVEPGRAYTLNVSANGKQLKASCTVPASTEVFTDVTYRRTGSSDGGYKHIVTYKWLDNGSMANYYRVGTGTRNTGDFGVYTSEFCTDLYDDKSYSGKTMTANCEVNSYFDPGSGVDVLVYLLNTDIHYYEYHRRRVNYFGDDPFSEPYPQYSNVTGGLGVFCAYRKSERSITLQ